MAKIKAFDAPTARMVSERVEKALVALADEFGVKIAVRGGKYSPGQFTAKLEIATIGDDGVVKTREADNFATLATLYGFQKTDLGREFRQGGRTFKITGLSPRGRKRPVVASDSSGRSYVFTAEDVLRSLKAIDGGQ